MVGCCVWVEYDFYGFGVIGVVVIGCVVVIVVCVVDMGVEYVGLVVD